MSGCVSQHTNRPTSRPTNRPTDQATKGQNPLDVGVREDEFTDLGVEGEAVHALAQRQHLTRLNE
jgi:hypothetical protein